MANDRAVLRPVALSLRDAAGMRDVWWKRPGTACDHPLARFVGSFAQGACVSVAVQMLDLMITRWATDEGNALRRAYNDE